MANHYKMLARFDLCSTDKSWQVVLTTSAGSVSALWDSDDEPDTDDLLPSDVLDLIEARTARPGFWCGNKTERLAKIESMRASIDAADRAWLESRVIRAREELKRQEDRLARLGAAS